MKRLLLEIASDVLGSFLETLPRTVDEAGPFLAGMTWAFCLFWATLIFVTYRYMGGRG